jgi:hypothetical protein
MNVQELSSSRESSCRKTTRYLIPFTISLAFAAYLLAGTAVMTAAPLYIPNSSFESPTTDFAAPDMNGWQKAPQPSWYNDPMFPWDQLVGQFLNPDEGSPSHIKNMDSRQGAYIFVSPEVAIFQDYNSIQSGSSTPSHAFNAQFEAGKSYTLTVGVIGNGGGMSNGATLEISMYYRDAASNKVKVAATTITNSAALFPTNDHFTDFQATIPFVQATNPWAGKRIGIQIASTVGFNLTNGYWDLDNVCLTESAGSNLSFESPVTDFAGPEMDSWQKASQPSWYNDPRFTWDQLAGQFLNTVYTNSDHIDNVEGKQAAYLFGVPDVAIFQDLNKKFEEGKSYALTLGVIGGGGMSNGVILKLSVYYRDASSNRVTVASTTITNSSALFPNATHLVDFQVNVPVVSSNAVWAGKNIGIEIASMADFMNSSGFWDLDNVRLSESLLANPSFESPETDFAGPGMDSWQKAPEPYGYTDPYFLWEQLVGQFLNTPSSSPDHINNVDGKQAAFLFARPNVAISQELNAKFEKGKGYQFTLGIIGGGGGMSNGATLQIRFFYRDASSNQVTVAATTITNTPGLYPTNNYLADFTVQVPVIRGSEAWANKRIGIQILSTVGVDKISGFWDLDNARLRMTEDPVITSQIVSNNHFQFILQSKPGIYQVLASSNILSAPGLWSSLGTITNLTGSASVTDTNTAAGYRFYQVRPSP